MKLPKTEREIFAADKYTAALPSDFDDDGHKTDWRYDPKTIANLDRIYSDALSEWDAAHAVPAASF